MNIQIKNASNEPIYLQIKKQLKDAIISGELEEDAQLPSIRFLARELRVSVITTKRAYDELEREGFLHSVQGKGSFVAAQNRALMKEKLLRKMEACFAEALHYADLADVSREEVHELLRLVEEDHDGSDLSSGRGKEI